MNSFLRVYLPLFVTAYLLIAFVVPSFAVYRKSGVNPVVFGRRDNAHDYLLFVMKVLIALLVAAVLLFSLSAKAYAHLNPFEYLEREWLKYCGLLLVHASLLWIAVAQRHMKQAWRIGIDEKNKTPLVTKGLFAVSRNPVFLGMLLSTAGLFLLLPNTLTFFTAGCSYVVIQVQIRLEEVFLEERHGGSYLAYKKRVRRLV